MPQRLPDLTFPSVSYGTHESRHTLEMLLYRGATSLSINQALPKIRNSRLGHPLMERLPLVLRLHEFMQGKLAAGGSKDDLHNTFRILCLFTCWCEKNNRSPTLETAAQDYVAWAEHLHHRCSVRKEITFRTAYRAATRADFALSAALNLRLGLKRHTKLHAKRGSRTTMWAKSERSNPEESFKFGRMLLDICDALSPDVIYGSLPITISFRDGTSWIEWSGLAHPDNVKGLHDLTRSNTARIERARKRYEAEHSFRTRHPLINLRIESELLIFIAQTGLNLSQAHKLKRGPIRFQRDGDEYRVYKSRRGGEVAFKMYREYRPLFERYLKWLDSLDLSVEDDRLFPFVYVTQIPSAESPPRFTALRRRFLGLNTNFHGPRMLRSIRVNWIVRHTDNVALTADMHQHAPETLLRHYEIPNHQVAAREITRFHELNDPALSPPGPGLCVGAGDAPIRLEEFGEYTPQPDCVSPAGCLFCWYHRDELSEDYVWSLASYQRLKAIELARYVPPALDAPTHPAEAVIGRITAKLEAISTTGAVALAWVVEARDRIREEHYHPAWDGFIQCLEPR